MNIILDKIYTELKRLKKVANKGDFADKLGYNRTYISELMNSDSGDIPDKLQDKLQTVFGIEPKFFEKGEGQVFADKRHKVHEFAQGNKNLYKRSGIYRFVNIEEWAKIERTQTEIDNMAKLLKKLDEEHEKE